MRDLDDKIWERFEEVELPFRILDAMMCMPYGAYSGYGKNVMEAINGARRGAQLVDFKELASEFGHFYENSASKFLRKYSDRLRIFPKYEFKRYANTGIRMGHEHSNSDLDNMGEVPELPEDHMLFYFIYNKKAEVFQIRFKGSGMKSRPYVYSLIKEEFGDDVDLDWLNSDCLPREQDRFLRIAGKLCDNIRNLQIYVREYDYWGDLPVSHKEYVDNRGYEHAEAYYPICGKYILQSEATMEKLKEWQEDGGIIMDRVVYVLLHNRTSRKYYLRRDEDITPKRKPDQNKTKN